MFEIQGEGPTGKVGIEVFILVRSKAVIDQGNKELLANTVASFLEVSLFCYSVLTND